MTIESARDLYQRINEDADSRASLEAVSTEEKKQLIKDAGYEVTCEEWKQIIAEIEAINSSQELSEEELEAVAGGAHTPAITAASGMMAYGGGALQGRKW